MFQQDMIKRAIEQLAEAIARAAGLARSKQHAEALECLQAAKGALPIVPGLIDTLSVDELLKMLGPEQTRQLGQLLLAEAELQERMGRSLLAARPRARGKQLLAALSPPRAPQALPRS